MHQNIKCQTSNNRFRRRGFTLVELLVVIAIVVVLLGILIPVVSNVRKSAQVADTQQLISTLAAAIERYHGDFRSYPGPFSNDQICKASGSLTFVDLDTGFTGGFAVKTTPGSGFDVGTATNSPATYLTMAENLVLALLGGLRVENPTTSPQLVYDPSLVGQGPQSLNVRSPKRYNAYADPINLSWRTIDNIKTGDYADDAGDCRDSIIPEFVDRFPDPMPLLVLRARAGASGVVTLNGPYQYDLNQIRGYTEDQGGGYIGVGKSLRGDYKPATPSPRHGLNDLNESHSLDPSDTANYVYPYSIVPYLKHPKIAPTVATPPSEANRTGTPRQKDSYILISAGADRVYGSSDDITNFGSLE